MDALRYEPQHALISGEEGLNDIKTIIESARAYLTNGGQLFIEHGFEQSPQIQAIFTAFHYDDVQTYCDLAGKPRVTSGRKSA